MMLPEDRKEQLQTQILESEAPREEAINVMFALQKHYGYLSDEAVAEAAHMLGMTTLEIEELATFYDFLYREPVGTYVIHVCDSAICWMYGEETVMDYLSKTLAIAPGETTADGLFTILPVCCVGYCDHAPVMLINGKPYGPLTPDAIDSILLDIRLHHPECEVVK
ncbi:MAG: NADH-quinone oxidoreductase subunit NuoE [Deltaproteobacteria bacterium]|nr:NADH-quinone oxidoreductase subunit NuoE [Deltaproteobacteria bacterium]